MKFQNSSDISWFRNFIQHRDTWEMLSPVITPKLIMGDLVTGPIWKQVLVLCNMTWGLLRWNVVLFESRTFLSSAYPTIPRAIMITRSEAAEHLWWVCLHLHLRHWSLLWIPCQSVLRESPQLIHVSLQPVEDLSVAYQTECHPFQTAAGHAPFAQEKEARWK